MELNLRIDWSELDVFGHVNNLEIMKYAQAARVNFLEKVGLMQMQRELAKGPILASIHTQFQKPLFFPGQVKIICKVDYVKTSSFKRIHRIYNDKNEQAAETHEIIVFYDFKKQHKLAITDELRRKFDQLENM